MSEKVKQSSFERTDLNVFAAQTNVYVPGFIDNTSNVKIPASQFIATAASAFKVVSLDAISGKPAVDNPSTKIIYLTKDESATILDPYTEWIYTGTDGEQADPTKWEVIGTTSMDLNDYKKTQDEYTASGLGTLKTITSLTQNENGEISTTAEDIPTADTSQKGLVQLVDSTSSTSTADAATPNSVKITYDLANSKYTKPSDGIPKTDLAQGVQDSLNLADTSLQSGDLDKCVRVDIVQNFTDAEKSQARTNIGVDLSTLATKTELNAKQDSLTAGTGIDITNNVISATSGIFIATYNSTTYSEIADALAAGNAVFLRYGGADIPISSSASSRHGFLQVCRNGHSYSQQTDSTRAFVVDTTDTWSMNTVPVSYNILAGAGLSYMLIDNDLTLSLSASFMPDLQLLTENTVNVDANTTLNIEAGKAYHVRVTTSASPIITLSTTSITTIHSHITVKNTSATSCSDVIVRFNDETGYQHDINLNMYETSAEYDFYVDIRKVGGTTVIARVYDLPCMFRKGWMGSAQYINDTAWIGYVR